MAGRRDHHAGHAGAAPGLTDFTRRGAIAAGLGLSLLPRASAAAEPPYEIPIRLAGNVPWTGVWLNGKGPFPFRIRSDANVFLLKEAFGRQLGLELLSAEWGTVGGAQHRRIARFFKANEMIVGGQVPMTNARLAIIDAVRERQQEDEPAAGPADRFVGAIPVPSDRISSFLWNAGVMRLSPELPADIAGYGKVPLRHFNNDLGWVALVECRFGGKPVRLTISTASPHAATFNPDAVKRLGLWDAPGPHYDRGGRYIGDDLEVRIARAGDLELGGLRFERPVIGLRDPRKALKDVYWSDGEIGMEVLRRVDLVFDPRKDMSWMRPTPAMNTPWGHDRAGFQVEAAEGMTRIARVDPGSPAERAGLKVGDVIGTNAENVARLMAAQSMAAGTKIDIPIVRDGARQRIAVVTEERL